ncbi:23S rRNA (adenine(1618)-N(6))-methyltransferase RlmF [Photobacterium carnosum]|uniref:Ribosomal RNA large subunit methyltransferase F n=1 Tax=Photobacterium carnosum TaxID=2023717 RepID=A0A2N4UVY5_9GAMM|nr:23S rRNA (adenine(1618)-N(6))-methyltransferase RlmF [Photobacterium carnosum]KAE8177344.1 23S rRNA (adenine(1618)-N(6))-methyltransferase [Photobacterium carnosum]MCD9498879.1 23S rRNA (adenine(1618)-N(6))-methyltransferase RlmF [Photobacterium carnosum]MCD9525746.1 23S rRNA (adenine(1618)-N(6))-methyltransferase RlmF [Photobacterium carnosum]MCD9541759.1 23S rRNA (adenine(1618)-N(6))-methyltransferase RlmF [Photobacterium carnosum]MCD9548984.1 23S rRNA (adenine(1618)-N(6))-methyltransfera
MTQKKAAQPKQGLHPRNPHRARYDFATLTQATPELAQYVSENAYGDLSVNFSDPLAVKTLNKALLKHFYHIDYWDIPAGFLCPPIPGRADYIHYIADLLAQSNGGVIPEGKGVRGLDIGIGANCVYPIIGHRAYGWQFVGSEIDVLAVKSAKFIAASNAKLKGAIQIRLQNQADNIFTDMIDDEEMFDFTMCNPPFHGSEEEAMAVSERKVRNLTTNSNKKRQAHGRSNKLSAFNAKSESTTPVLNFGGQKAELWCTGGEVGFIKKMINQSATKATQCFWFTTLVSKKENLGVLYKQLEKVSAFQVKTIEMSQGQKISRVVAWTFLNEEQQAEWQAERWA